MEKEGKTVLGLHTARQLECRAAIGPHTGRSAVIVPRGQSPSAAFKAAHPTPSVLHRASSILPAAVDSVRGVGDEQPHGVDCARRVQGMALAATMWPYTQCASRFGAACAASSVIRFSLVCSSLQFKVIIFFLQIPPSQDNFYFDVIKVLGPKEMIRTVQCVCQVCECVC
jgi:hypothetical protein